MRKKIVAGNWKMNTTVSEGVELAKAVVARSAEVPANVGLIVAAPFTHLVCVADAVKGSKVEVSAQNCADHEKGAYTGEVAVNMLVSAGCTWTILGHSERRQYYAESYEMLAEKVRLALANGLKVIFCIGEVKEEREAGKQNEVVKAQLEGSVFGLSAEEWKNITLAYEPVWAIGTGLTATPAQAEEIHAYIRSLVAEKYGKEAAEDTTILYGGSCNEKNAAELFACPDIDGGLIGGAALVAEKFLAIIAAR